MLIRYLAPVACLLGIASAQVHTDCNPLEKDCPADPAFSTKHTWNFNSTPNGDLWETTAGIVDYTDEGAKFTINQQGDSPTIRTNFYFFGGRTEMWMKAAPGQGIVSSMMWLSDDLDEVDWEFLGTNDTHANTNWFGKGNEVWTNGAAFAMDGIHDDYHNYTCYWTEDKLEWHIDGALVRTLLPDQANNTKNYPQTPMRMSIGIWAGGDPSLPKGTREWAGGDTDYDNGPYNMYVKSVAVEDFSTGKEYEWSDRSGSWDSINIVKGNAEANKTVNEPPESEQPSGWDSLSDSAKTGIYAGAGAAGALLLGALIFYCIRQRRRGAQENKLAAERERQERLEMEQFRQTGQNPDALKDSGVDYNAREMQNDGAVGVNSYNIPDSPASNPNPFDEKAYGAGAAAGIGAAIGGATAMRAPTVPLLNDNMQSSRTASPAPSSYHDAGSVRSPVGGGLGAPPAAAGGFVDPRSQYDGYSTPPASPFGDPRVPGSPYSNRSPQQGGYAAPPRVASPFDDPMDQRTSQQNTFGAPSPYSPPSRTQTPMARSQSPMVRQQTPMMRTQSPGMPPTGALPAVPPGGSAYARMNTASPQGYGMDRMQSPGPRMSPAPRGYDNGGQPGYGGPPSHGGYYGQ